MSGPIAVAALGETRREWCSQCFTSGLDVTAMYGLADLGPVPLGVFETCLCGVGPRWRCRYCGCVLPPGGKRIFNHLLTEHGESAMEAAG